MRAAVQDRYGPPEVLRIADIPRPELKDGQVLVRVAAATVSQTDVHARAAHPFPWRFVAGLRKPRWRCLGVEFSGVVEDVAPGVTAFAIGDEVFGHPRHGARRPTRRGPPAGQAGVWDIVSFWMASIIARAWARSLSLGC